MDAMHMRILNTYDISFLFMTLLASMGKNNRHVFYPSISLLNYRYRAARGLSETYVFD
jgi:hypothetical protein